MFAFYGKYVPLLSGSFGPIAKTLILLLASETITYRIVTRGLQLSPTLTAFETIGALLNLSTEQAIRPLSTRNKSNKKIKNVVQFRNATVHAETGGISLLKNVTLDVRRKSLTLVTGGPNSGKSILLRTILGRTIVESGSVHVLDSSVGYCSQHEWLQSRSIQDNIVGPGVFHQAWYDTVKEICVIEKEIARLPHTDNTIINQEQYILGSAFRQRLVC